MHYLYNRISSSNKKSQNDQVKQILCTIQTFLLSFSSNTSIAFTITIPTITYKLLVNPSFIEKHLTIVHLIIAGVCWGFGMIITIIYISITSTDFFEYGCWYTGDAIFCVVNGINLGVLLIFVFVLYKLKRNIENLIRDNQIDSPETYLHIFTGFLVLVIFAFATLSLGFINQFCFDDFNEALFWSLIVCNILECLFYVLDSYVFCFQREMLPCFSSSHHNYKDKMRITENISLMLMSSDNKSETINL